MYNSIHELVLLQYNCLLTCVVCFLWFMLKLYWSVLRYFIHLYSEHLMILALYDWDKLTILFPLVFTLLITLLLAMMQLLCTVSLLGLIGILIFCICYLQYISLLFIGILIAISVRGFLTNLMKVILSLFCGAWGGGGVSF